jgi:hypothetical protein
VAVAVKWGQWHSGTMAQWHNGTVAQWHSGTVAVDWVAVAVAVVPWQWHGWQWHGWQWQGWQWRGSSGNGSRDNSGSVAAAAVWQQRQCGNKTVARWQWMASVSVTQYYII